MKLRQAQSRSTVEALATAAATLAAWGAAAAWMEDGRRLLDDSEQASAGLRLAEDAAGRRAEVDGVPADKEVRTLRSAAEVDELFGLRLLTSRIEARQFEWRPPGRPRIDGIRATLATTEAELTIEAEWNDGRQREAVLWGEEPGGGLGSWGRTRDGGWPPEAAIRHGLEQAAETARRRAQAMGEGRRHGSGRGARRGTPRTEAGKRGEVKKTSQDPASRRDKPV